MVVTSSTSEPTRQQCDARWRGSGQNHSKGERCKHRARLAFAAGGTTVLLCGYHAKVFSVEMGKRGVAFRLTELPPLPLAESSASTC